jgi:hypothetical protein
MYPELFVALDSRAHGALMKSVSKSIAPPPSRRKSPTPQVPSSQRVSSPHSQRVKKHSHSEEDQNEKLRLLNEYFTNEGKLPLTKNFKVGGGYDIGEMAGAIVRGYTGSRKTYLNLKSWEEQYPELFEALKKRAVDATKRSQKMQKNKYIQEVNDYYKKYGVLPPEGLLSIDGVFSLGDFVQNIITSIRTKNEEYPELYNWMGDYPELFTELVKKAGL